MYETTASARWGELNGKRQGFITRCEQYAEYTLPKICLRDGYEQANIELQHDWQALGAQGVNHLSNKLVLALFAPSRPFFRLDANTKLRDQLANAGQSIMQAAAELAAAEMDAVKEMDRLNMRTKIYDAMKHIVITGNCLIILEDEGMRAVGIKNYCVKRDVYGCVLEGILKEKVQKKALKPEILAVVEDTCQTDADGCVEMYHWWCRGKDMKYTETVWIGQQKLDDKFGGVYKEQDLPYRAITWDLASGDDYGTGLVEDYAGDFLALSQMSKAIVQAAMLASQFRWIVDPNSLTDANAVAASANGDVLTGTATNFSILQAKGGDIPVLFQSAQTYINRIGQAFLLQSAVTRQAERVTKEEILRNADELETSLGGAYSRIAVDVQMPLAYYLLKKAGKNVMGSDLEPVIVTGLAALSRTGDRDNLMMLVSDVAAFDSLSPQTKMRFNEVAVFSALCSARGLATETYLLSDAQYQERVAMQQQQMMQMQAQAAGIDVAADRAKNPPKE